MPWGMFHLNLVQKTPHLNKTAFSETSQKSYEIITPPPHQDNICTIGWGGVEVMSLPEEVVMATTSSKAKPSC